MFYSTNYNLTFPLSICNGGINSPLVWSTIAAVGPRAKFCSIVPTAVISIIKVNLFKLYFSFKSQFVVSIFYMLSIVF